MADPADQINVADAVGRQLAMLYALIHDRSMQNMPVVNQALNVEAIGFRSFNVYTLGILITPWFMNLIAVPSATSENTPAGAALRIALPAGDVDFTSGTLAGFGALYSASLFSPMFDFADMDAARLTAQEVMHALFDCASPQSAKSMDRRAFLRGRKAENVASHGASR